MKVTLTALGKLIKQAFDALLGRFGLGTVTPKPLLDPLTFSPSKVYVGEDNVVRIKGAGLTAQPKELAPALQQAKSKAGPMQQMAYTTAETKRSELTGLTTQLTAELRKPKPQAMRVVDLRKHAQTKEQELSTALHGLCGIASCFGAGTPLWGVRGRLPIEAAQIGDAVWTRGDGEARCPQRRDRAQWRVAVFAVERERRFGQPRTTACRRLATPPIARRKKRGRVPFSETVSGPGRLPFQGCGLSLRGRPTGRSDDPNRSRCAVC